MQRSFALLTMTAMALMLAACASPPPRFYTLAGAAAINTGAPPRIDPGTHSRIFIEVSPVNVPERLARPQIVVRTDSVRIDVLEQDRWSAPFNSELRDALAGGVANRLGAIDATHGGRPAGQPVYRIAVELGQLDAVKGGNIDAAFGWTITRSDNGGSAVCRLTVAEPANGMGIDGVVRGMQQIVAHAADAIAADVMMLSEGKSGVCNN